MCACFVHKWAEKIPKHLHSFSLTFRNDLAARMVQARFRSSSCLSGLSWSGHACLKLVENLRSCVCVCVVGVEESGQETICSWSGNLLDMRVETLMRVENVLLSGACVCERERACICSLACLKRAIDPPTGLCKSKPG